MSSKLCPLLATTIRRRHSLFFGFFKSAFNDVDRDRLAAVGPDRLCAEWMLKNGGTVKLDIYPAFLVDYLELPPDHQPVRVEQLDASRASVIAKGFAHLRNCDYIRRLVLDDCSLMENGALEKLRLVAGSLAELQVSNCPGVQASGLAGLAELVNLRKLCLFNLANAGDLGVVEQELGAKLPNCQIVRECHQSDRRCEVEN